MICFNGHESGCVGIQRMITYNQLTFEILVVRYMSAGYFKHNLQGDLIMKV